MSYFAEVFRGPRLLVLMLVFQHRCSTGAPIHSYMHHLGNRFLCSPHIESRESERRKSDPLLRVLTAALSSISRFRLHVQVDKGEDWEEGDKEDGKIGTKLDPNDEGLHGEGRYNGIHGKGR